MKLSRRGFSAMLILCAAIAGCNNESDKMKTVAPVKVNTLTIGGEDQAGSAISYSGTITANKTIDLSFQVSGTVLNIPVSSGQYVTKGQLIAAVDETVYRNQYNAQQAQANLARENSLRVAEVFKKGSIAEIKMIEAKSNAEQASSAAKATYQNILHARLYAPQSGYIGEKRIESGATAAPGVPVVQLLDISQVKVNIAIPEAEINQFKKGDQAAVTIQALQNLKLEGKVDEVAVSSAQGIPTYTVKVLLSNGNNKLKPGMVCTILFNNKKKDSGKDEAGQEPIVVPVQAVQIDENNVNFVYVTNAEGNKAIRKNVKTGELFNNGIAISSGLQQGEKLIITGYHHLTNDTPIQIVK
ncbi:efflux RND transporter periplasmic adaptor subunit [Pedobacter sp. AW31-3R]|uniref:efflux RND transporter periplasmic adaptor subunit n=1 Tax=Pedobacter sp. AW31-3R TaxID=3445781 RepID=UPI003F9FB1A9